MGCATTELLPVHRGTGSRAGPWREGHEQCPGCTGAHCCKHRSCGPVDADLDPHTRVIKTCTSKYTRASKDAHETLADSQSAPTPQLSSRPLKSQAHLHSSGSFHKKAVQGLSRGSPEKMQKPQISEGKSSH